MRRMSREVARRYMAGDPTFTLVDGLPPVHGRSTARREPSPGCSGGRPDGYLGARGVPREALPFLADTMGPNSTPPGRALGCCQPRADERPKSIATATDRPVSSPSPHPNNRTGGG